MQKEKLRKIISLFLSFVTALLIFFTGVGAAVCLVFSTPVVAAVMKSEKYISNAEEEILFELESYAGPGGLPSDFFADGLDHETLRKNVDVAIKHAIEHTPFKAVDFVDETRERIYDFAESEGMNTEEISTRIVTLLNHFESAYKTYLCSSALRGIGSVMRLIFPYGIIAVLVLAVLSILLYNVVYRMNGDNKLYFCGSFCGGGLMLSILPIGILLSGTVGGININSPCIFHLISTLVYAFLFSLIAEAVLIFAFVIIKRLALKKR